MSENIELVEHCVMKWYELTPEMAEKYFTDDVVFESRADQGVSVTGRDEVYGLLADFTC